MSRIPALDTCPPKKYRSKGSTQETKRFQEWAAHWTAEAEAVLKSFGAQPSTFYDWVLTTEYGPFIVAVYPEFLACRFDDPTVAAKAINVIGFEHVNTHSGKFNLHMGDSLTISERISCLRGHLARACVKITV